MVSTSTIKEYIVNEDETYKISEAIEQGGYYGMQSFDQCLINLLKENQITIEDAVLNSSNGHDFKIKMKQVGLYANQQGEPGGFSGPGGPGGFNGPGGPGNPGGFNSQGGPAGYNNQGGFNGQGGPMPGRPGSGMQGGQGYSGSGGPVSNEPPRYKPPGHVA
jgi:hypothetical protein